MPTKLQEETPRERELALAIRDAVEAAIAVRGWGSSEIAERLGLLLEGWELFQLRRWPLEIAYRVAEALDVPVRLQVGGPPAS